MLRWLGLGLFLVAAVMSSFVSLAAAPDCTQGNTCLDIINAKAYGGSTTPIGVIIGNILVAIFGVLGVIFTILIIYAGFLWFNARGVAGEVTKAQDLMRQAVIGLIIMVTAQAISYWVITQLAGVITK